jgi:KDO2-lipid IV(A) lauroyltransferase
MPLPSTTRDVRLGGKWSLPQRAKNDALWAVAWVALAAVSRLSGPALVRLGRALGLIAHTVAGRSRRTAAENVALAFPDWSPSERDALVRHCFATLGGLLGETVALLQPRAQLAPLVLQTAGREVLDRAVAAGRGVVFASAHLGPWERVAGALVSAGVPLTTVARESYDPRFSRLYERLRLRTGVRVIWRSQPGAAAGILRTLRDGGVLGIPMDLRSRVSSRNVAFLGVPAPTAIGPARIALRAAATVVVGTAAPAPAPIALDATPCGRRSTFTVSATPIRTEDLGSGEEDALELTRRINAELSRRIRELPHAWPWMHERWTTTANL